MMCRDSRIPSLAPTAGVCRWTIGLRRTPPLPPSPVRQSADAHSRRQRALVRPLLLAHGGRLGARRLSVLLFRGRREPSGMPEPLLRRPAPSAECASSRQGGAFASDRARCCCELAKDNGIRQTEQVAARLDQPPSWDDFLRGVAVENMDDKTLDKLATGARSRTRRKHRHLVSGGETDLYRAILASIANTGPKRSLTYQQLRDALQDVLTGLPQSNEMTETLKRLSDIAAAEARDQYGQPSDPALEYDAEDRVLHVVDPFFAFRLRWGPIGSGKSLGHVAHAGAVG
jgi:hypothetical protein